MISEDDVNNVLSCRTKDEVSSYLEDNIIYINEGDRNGRTLLINASIKGNLDIVKILIELEADIYSIDSSGWTALIHASWNNKADIIEYLVEAGANVDGMEENQVDNDYEDIDSDSDSDNEEGYLSPIVYAAISKSLDALKILVKLGANIETRDENGRTPLAISIASSKAETITLYLIYKGADINTQDENGITPLMDSIERKDYSATILLLAYNANKLITDIDGLNVYNYIGSDYINLFLLNLNREYLDKIKDSYETYLNETYNTLVEESESLIETDFEQEPLGDSDSDWDNLM